MPRSTRLLLLLSTGVCAFIITVTLFRWPSDQLTAKPLVVFQSDKQYDMTNVQFSVEPPDRLWLAHMRRNHLDTDKVATMTELRDDPQIVPHLLHMMSVLDDDWPFRIYHSNENAHLFEARLLARHLDSGKLTLVPLNIDLTSHAAVSDYMAHRAYWDNLAPATHVLIFQTDSILCSRSSARVEDFFAYDYIGAPVHERFHDDLRDNFMNGGLSLRNRSAMLHVIESFLPFSDPDNDIFQFEDQFFVRRLREVNGSLPTRDTAMQFSVESVFYPTPLGIHQAERYLDAPSDAEHIRTLKDDWCPEMHLLYGRVGPKAFVCDRESEHFDAEACAERDGVPSSEPQQVDEAVAITEPPPPPSETQETTEYFVDEFVD